MGEPAEGKVVVRVGERALRFNAGKPILSRLLCFPAALSGVAKVTECGEKKYAKYNFTKGAPASESVDCMLRHLVKWWCRSDVDPETMLHELNALAWNALRLCDEAQRQPGGYVDDRPPAGVYDAEQILALFAGKFPGQVLAGSEPAPEPTGSVCATRQELTEVTEVTEAWDRVMGTRRRSKSSRRRRAASKR